MNYQVHFASLWEFWQWHREQVQGVASGTELHSALRAPTPCFLNVHNLVTTHQQGSVLLTMQSRGPLTEPYSGMFWKLSGDAA